MNPELKKGIRKIKLMDILGTSPEKIERELAKYFCNNCGADWNTCQHQHEDLRNPGQTIQTIHRKVNYGDLVTDNKKICLEIAVSVPGHADLARTFTIYECWIPRK